jgi:endogenous inhibitor of DNA gyrase (YacG/DUF329 family)
MPRCPVCDSTVDLQTASMVPFCSDRCRLIDLGRWLDESYGLPEPRRPGPPADDADDES